HHPRRRAVRQRRARRGRPRRRDGAGGGPPAGTPRRGARRTVGRLPGRWIVRIRRAVLVGVVGLALAAPAAGAQEAEELAGYVGTATGAAFSVQPVFP